MSHRTLGRIVAGAAGPVALTVASAMTSPAVAARNGPAGVPSTSGTFYGCTYRAYQPILRGSHFDYVEFWAGFNCPNGDGYSIDIFVQKRAVGSGTWATPNTGPTHIYWRAENPTNYYDYLGQYCSMIEPNEPYYVRTKAVMTVGYAGGPGSPAIYSPERLIPADAVC